MVRSDAHLLAVLRYVARKPVAAGLCARPGEWPWSAHRALVGAAPAPGFLSVDAVLEAQIWRTLTAAGPLGPSSASYSTFAPSSRVR